MVKKSIMTPAILKTILNSAPIIIQGTSKLIQIIKERNDDQSKQEQDIPATIEGLKKAIDRLEQRLDKNDDSDVEQIKLIEQLAKQNEALAKSLSKTYNRLAIISYISIIAIILAAIGIILVIR